MRQNNQNPLVCRPHTKNHKVQKSILDVTRKVQSTEDDGGVLKDKLVCRNASINRQKKPEKNYRSRSIEVNS